MFKRIGGPANIEVVNFKKTSTVDVICSTCKRVIGRKSGRFIKFSGSSAVVVSPVDCICSKCGGKNKGM